MKKYTLYISQKPDCTEEQNNLTERSFNVLKLHVKRNNLPVVIKRAPGVVKGGKWTGRKDLIQLTPMPQFGMMWAKYFFREDVDAPYEASEYSKFYDTLGEIIRFIDEEVATMYNS